MTIIEEATMKSIQGIYKKLPDLNGVTLRDLFAMSVMPTLLKDFLYDDESIKSMARKSYIIADAILEARKK